MNMEIESTTFMSSLKSKIAPSNPCKIINLKKSVNALREIMRPISDEDIDSGLTQIETKNKYADDYGWLSPDGTFYKVEWSEHNAWAAKKLETDFGETVSKTERLHPADAMTKRGWILLHNPSFGPPRITKSDRNLTKAQAEFLYEFFIERNMKEEANSVIEYL